MKSIGIAGRQSSPAGLIIRQKQPNNLEMPFDQLDSYLTPTELFYIRSHFPTPSIDVANYQLRIDGSVRSPLELSYKELREMPSETRIATLECAGNGRVFLVPQVRGGPWVLTRWQAGAARASGNEAEVRDRPAKCLRNPLSESDVHGLWRCMGRRERCNGDRCKHRWWPDLGQGAFSRSCTPLCVATLE